MEIAKTPKQITKPINQLCKSLSPTGELVWIPYARYHAADMGQCYFNVAAFIQEHGGEMQQGYAIYELPNFYLYAEHHAIVKHQGQLLCITPAFGDEHILFQPSSVVFEGKPITGVHYPLHPSDRIKRLCELIAKRVQLSFQGKRGSREDTKLAIEEQKIIDYHLAKLKEHRKKK